MNNALVRVGIGILVFDDKNRVLLGKRKGSHGAGEYASPGGHLEYLESVEACARRELIEECGIGMEVGPLRFQFCANIRLYKPKHYLHIGFTTQLLSGSPVLKEPDRCEGWAWYDLEQLPKPLFEPTYIGLHPGEREGDDRWFNGWDAPLLNSM